MSNKISFLWLEGVFNQNTLKLFPSISVASNFWQVSFIENLISLGNKVDVVGFPAERSWPFGRLLIHRKSLEPSRTIGGVGLGYINLPFFRVVAQFVMLVIWILRYLITKPIKPDYIVVYSCLEKSWIPTASIWAARLFRKFSGIPILCFVADGEAPNGADRYVHVAWSSYLLAGKEPPKLHFDGGVPLIEKTEAVTKVNKKIEKTIFMYIGALTKHGGINELATAFTSLKDRNTELWICGRGENSKLQELANREDRIKLMGFLDDDKLYELAFQATFFVNPRPLDFDPNKLNFPSKLLLYLAFGKPVISTLSLGMNPEYSSVVIEIENETEVSLIRSLKSAIHMDDDVYNDFCKKVVHFKELNSWDKKISKFIDWL